MMQSKKTLSEKESLQLIGRMLYEAKGYYQESGLGSIIYGVTIAACSLLSYGRATGALAFPFWPFYLMIPVFFLQHWVQRREDTLKKAKTFTSEAVDAVWLGFFISALAACCGSFAGLQNFVGTIVLFLMAFATFLTGMLTKMRYPFWAAGACWLLAIASFFIQGEVLYLFLAAAALLVWVVPGFILWSVFRKQHA